MKTRVTQREIAREANVDVSTVSLCLNHHPRIPESTRERVLAIATKMGYRRDPALSAIAASRWSNRRDDSGLVIAFVVDDMKAAEIELKLYQDGVREQATSLGYRIEIFELKRYPDVSALLRVIRTRGIRGIITGQSRKELPKSLFADTSIPIIHCGYLREVPGDVVRPDLRLAVIHLLESLSDQFRKVACILPIERELHSDRVILGAALSVAKMLPRNRVKVEVIPFAFGSDHLQKCRRYQADAVVTINERHADSISELIGIERNRIYTVHTLPPFTEKQGMDLRLGDVGRAAMNLLEMRLRHQPLTTESYRQSLLVAPRNLTEGTF